MKKILYKRIFAVVLTAVLMVNALPLPGSTIYAEEINIEDSEDIASDRDIVSDDINSDKDTKELLEEEQTEEEQQTEGEQPEEEQAEEEHPEEQSEESLSEEEQGQIEDRDISAEDSGDSDKLSETQEAESISEEIHIGQIRNDADFSDFDNYSDTYDMPIILEKSSKIRLFVVGKITAAYDWDDENILTWSILRGETGAEPGTTNIMNGEDDWTEFETVNSSPYFTTQEETDESSSLYKTLVISASDLEDDDSNVYYDYYIRAALHSIKEQTEYMAVTTLPVKVTATEENEEQVVDENEAQTSETNENTVDTETDESDVFDEKCDNTITAGADNGLEEYVEPDIENQDFRSDEEDIMETDETDVEEHVAEKNNDYPTVQDDNVIELSDDMWIAGFERESEALTYTGGKITQQLRVYHKGTLLKEKIDYVLTYKNNINAATYNSVNAPSVTITMRGQYSGVWTLYFTIATRNIDENHTQGYEQVIYYSQKLKITEPIVYYGSKKLVSNKDFVCDYSSLPESYTMGDSYEEGKLYKYTVNGTGNYTGSFTMNLTVVKDKNFDFGTATVTLDKKQYTYQGKELSSEDVKVSAVKLGKTIMDPGLYEYKVYAGSAGTGYVEIFPSEEGVAAGYRGIKKVNIKVVGDRSIKDAQIGDNWQEAVTFSQKKVNDQGGICQDKTGVLMYYADDVGEPLTEGVDYTVKYANNKKVGTTTVTFTGIGRYTGSFKKTFKINPNTVLYLEWCQTDENGKPIVSYTKGGANPQFNLKDEDSCVLSSKTDYSIKLKDNTKVGIMTCEITGKGNYEGYKSTTEIEVISADISQGSITVEDKQYSSKANAWKSAVTITDVNGKKLVAGTDYDKTLIYNYDGMEDGLLPQPGTVVHVTVSGINNYAGTSITGSYHIYNTNIGRLYIVIDAQEYTGKEIELQASDIHMYANKSDAKIGKEIAESCYKVVSYTNNIKVGTAIVILRGCGDYGGTRTCYFKISKKNYLTVRASEITLSETSVSMGVGNSIRLIASIVPEDAWNKTVIWTSSNSEVATVSQDGMITAKASGKATITATAQDTGKKATCKVTVSVIQVTSFSLNTTKIEQSAGTQYQLTATEIQPKSATYSTIEWESTNLEIASVDVNGKVTLHKAGMAVINAYANERKFVEKCLVIVNGEKEDAPEGNYLTPQMFRTCEEDDDTKAFNEAIKNLSGNCDTVYVPAGTYKIDAQTGIELNSMSNIKFVMSPNAIIKAVGNSSRIYNVIHIKNAENVTISGGQIVGERYEHSGKTGEWGMGIGIYDSNHIRITGVKISECWGDGIYIGSHHEYILPAGCSNITIEKCNLRNNRRNNLSIVSAKNVFVDQCSFDYANGTAPEYGIDIETNNSRNPCEHITISNSTFDGNAQASIGIITEANDIKISGCTLNGTFINYAGENVVVSNSTINGEVDARIGISLEEGTKINDGGAKEDLLIASFNAAQGPYTFREYQTDDSNVMSCNVIESDDSPSGKVLCLRRQSYGTREAGYYIDLMDLTGGAFSILEKGAAYRFEYFVRGIGQWGIKTDQTGWYPCVPMSDKFSTGIVTYEAGPATSCRLMFYAVDCTDDMYLEIDSIKIYKVR